MQGLPGIEEDDEEDKKEKSVAEGVKEINAPGKIVHPKEIRSQPERKAQHHGPCDDDDPEIIVAQDIPQLQPREVAQYTAVIRHGEADGRFTDERRLRFDQARVEGGFGRLASYESLEIK